MPTISLFVLTVSNLKQEWEDPAGDCGVWQCLSELDSPRGNISLGKKLFIWSAHNFPLYVGFPLFLLEWVWVILFGLATKKRAQVIYCITGKLRLFMELERKRNEAISFAYVLGQLIMEIKNTVACLQLCNLGKWRQ